MCQGRYEFECQRFEHLRSRIDQISARTFGGTPARFNSATVAPSRLARRRCRVLFGAVAMSRILGTLKNLCQCRDEFVCQRFEHLRSRINLISARTFGGTPARFNSATVAPSRLARRRCRASSTLMSSVNFSSSFFVFVSWAMSFVGNAS